eukprot:3101538-Pyramimonas_sp.AAC.1
MRLPARFCRGRGIRAAQGVPEALAEGAQEGLCNLHSNIIILSRKILRSGSYDGSLSALTGR